jgi:hypothetical protein
MCGHTIFCAPPPVSVSQKHEPCGNDVAIQKTCAPGLTCVSSSTLPVSEHQAGTCEEVSSEGGPCGNDVAIQKICASGLTCVFPSGIPVSEHQAGKCTR